MEKELNGMSVSMYLLFQNDILFVLAPLSRTCRIYKWPLVSLKLLIETEPKEIWVISNKRQFSLGTSSIGGRERTDKKNIEVMQN